MQLEDFDKSVSFKEYLFIYLFFIEKSFCYILKKKKNNFILFYVTDYFILLFDKIIFCFLEKYFAFASFVL